MSAPEPPKGPVDEFDQIARLLRPLTRGAPEALELLDDAAVIPSRPGFNLVVTTDTLVEGVHFLPSDPLDAVARKLLRVNLSDLAAKAAEPYGYFLCASWSPRCGWDERAAFAAGLDADQTAFGLVLLGGDTTSTPGPLTLSLTALGWVAAGRMVKRGGAQAGDVLLVSGTIGDGFLGLMAAQGELAELDGDGGLARRYAMPVPRLELREALAAHASAAADVSDGLLADAANLARASGCRVTIDLALTPLSAPARLWLGLQGEPATALAALASGGDDYEIVCAARPEAAEALIAAAALAGVAMTAVGRFEAGEGLRVTHGGTALTVDRTGYRHG